MKRKKIRVLLADDHKVIREGLVLLINAQPDMRVVAEAANGREAWRQAQSTKPEVAVLDIAMPEMNGLDAIDALQRDCPTVKVVALTMHEDETYLRELMRKKASGYVLKSSAGEELLEAIRDAAAGRDHFDLALATKALCEGLARQNGSEVATAGRPTEKERRVLRLVAWGYTNKEIGGILGLSPKTIEAYKLRFAKKLNLHGRAQIVRYALQRGWLKEEKSAPPESVVAG